MYTEHDLSENVITSAASCQRGCSNIPSEDLSSVLREEDRGALKGDFHSERKRLEGVRVDFYIVAK